MALDAIGRALVFTQAMRQAELGALGALTKPDLKAAVDAIDDWIESAQGTLPPLVGFNAALPLPARTVLTAQQKALLFTWVLMRRVGLFPVDGA